MRRDQERVERGDNEKRAAPELIARLHTQPEHTDRAAGKRNEIQGGMGHGGVFLHITRNSAHFPARVTHAEDEQQMPKPGPGGAGSTPGTILNKAGTHAHTTGATHRRTQQCRRIVMTIGRYRAAGGVGGAR